MKSKKGRKRDQYNWQEMRADYLTSDEKTSITDILRRHGIERNEAYITKRTSPWIVEKKRMWEKVIEKVKKKFVTNTVNEFDDYIKLINVTRQQIAIYLKNNVTQDNNGNYVLDSNKSAPDKLAAISLALERILKSHRLIRGKSTENFETKNYHLAVVELMEQTRAGKIGDIKLDGNDKDRI